MWLVKFWVNPKLGPKPRFQEANSKRHLAQKFFCFGCRPLCRQLKSRERGVALDMEKR